MGWGGECLLVEFVVGERKYKKWKIVLPRTGKEKDESETMLEVFCDQQKQNVDFSKLSMTKFYETW
jgi:hypothetical protein